MFKIILHVFTAAEPSNPAWTKVKGEPTGVYAISGYGKETLPAAKKYAKFKLKQSYFPPLCYVLRAYVCEEDGKVLFRYQRVDIIEQDER